jgi:aminotransferase
MNDISSAIGVAQLKKVDAFISKRKEITNIYNEEFKNLDWLLTTPELEHGNESSYYFYWIHLKEQVVIFGYFLYFYLY